MNYQKWIESLAEKTGLKTRTEIMDMCFEDEIPEEMSGREWALWVLSNTTYDLSSIEKTYSGRFNAEGVLFELACTVVREDICHHHITKEAYVAELAEKLEKEVEKVSQYIAFDLEATKEILMGCSEEKLREIEEDLDE